MRALLALALLSLACTIAPADPGELAGVAAAPVTLRVDIRPTGLVRPCLAGFVLVVDVAGAEHRAPAGSCSSFTVELPEGGEIFNTDVLVSGPPVGYALSVSPL